MDGIKDIVPDLLQAILDSYHDNISKNKELQDLIDTIKEGKGDYNTMLKAATLYGNCLSGAFAKNIDADILPDGKMYYNIAERLLTPLVKENYDNVAPLCMDVQQVLNKQNGINLQPVKPSYKVDKTKGMASYVSNGDTYNQRMWSFLQSLETNSKSIVDDSVKENCEFQAKSGMSPVIERHASAKACEWCQDMEGTYRYPYDVPDDVYKRHDNCNCTVVYKKDKSAKEYQDVWTKKWNDGEKESRLETESKTMQLLQKHNTQYSSSFNYSKKEDSKSQKAELKRRKLLSTFEPLARDRVVNVLRKESKAWIDSLSDFQINAIKKYTLNLDFAGNKIPLFQMINNYLRTKDENTEKDETLERIITNISSALKMNTLSHNIVCYRTTDQDYYSQYSEGDIFESKSFLSTSVTRKGALNNEYMVIIYAYEGTRGAYIELISEYPKQREFLVDKNTVFYVLSKSEKVIELVVIIDES